MRKVVDSCGRKVLHAVVCYLFVSGRFSGHNRDERQGNPILTCLATSGRSYARSVAVYPHGIYLMIISRSVAFLPLPSQLHHELHVEFHLVVVAVGIVDFASLLKPLRSLMMCWYWPTTLSRTLLR
jgi:hypothetical protein